LLDILEQLRAWGHAHHKQVADDTALEDFHRLDALVDGLAGALGIAIAYPATTLRCAGFTGLPLYRSNVSVAQGGQRIALDPGWDNRLNAVKFQAQAVIDLAAAEFESVQRTAGHCDEQWMAANMAVARAEKASLPVSLSWLSRSAQKHGVKTRPQQMPGNHKLEVEWNSLAGYLAGRRATKSDADDPSDNVMKEVEDRKKQADEQKRRDRSAD
jgi:hypothetical protein